MRQSVRDMFFDYTAGREGFTPFMYCDTLNLVTTGVGNLIDAGPNHNPGNNSPSIVRARLNNVVSAGAMQPAMSLPWRLKAPGWSSKNPLAGDLVSPSEVADAWTKVKRQNEVVPDFSQQGGFKYAGLTNLTLDMSGLKSLFSRTLNSFDATLRKTYSGYEEWPADAQLATMSMSWAMGPAFFPVLGFTAFKQAVDRLDFQAAAIHSVFKGGGGLLDPASRNFAHNIMFNNAHAVVKAGAGRDRIYFPGAGPTSSAVSVVSKLRFGDAAVGVLGSGLLGWTLYDWWKGRNR